MGERSVAIYRRLSAIRPEVFRGLYGRALYLRTSRAARTGNAQDLISAINDLLAEVGSWTGLRTNRELRIRMAALSRAARFLDQRGGSQAALDFADEAVQVGRAVLARIEGGQGGGPSLPDAGLALSLALSTRAHLSAKADRGAAARSDIDEAVERARASMAGHARGARGAYVSAIIYQSRAVGAEDPAEALRMLVGLQRFAIRQFLLRPLSGASTYFGLGLDVAVARARTGDLAGAILAAEAVTKTRLLIRIDPIGWGPSMAYLHGQMASWYDQLGDTDNAALSRAAARSILPQGRSMAEIPEHR